MKMSRRAKRMERHHRRNHGHVALNIIAMVDMLTVLVLFLLVNSGNVQNLPSAKAVRLPESTAELPPKDTVIITVNNQDIVAQGRKVASVSATMQSRDDIIPGLLEELKYQAQKSDATPKAADGGGEITIMGDKEIPYALLKKIMLTCTQANYTHISLAVMYKSAKG